MARNPYILRQELDAGQNFSKARPQGEASVDGLVYTYEGAAQGGLFDPIQTVKGQFFELRCVVVQFEDASQFRVSIRQTLQATEASGEVLGESSDYDRLLAKWSSGSWDYRSALVDAEIEPSSNKAALIALDWLLAPDEAVLVETTGASNRIWAELAALPVDSALATFGEGA